MPYLDNAISIMLSKLSKLKLPLFSHLKISSLKIKFQADYEAGGLEIMGNSDVAADQIAVRGRKDMIFQNPEKAIKNILRGYQNYARR